MRRGLLPIAPLREQNSEIEMRRRLVALKLQNAEVFFDRIVHIAGNRVRQSKILVRDEKIWLRLECEMVIFNRALEVPLSQQIVAERDVNVCGSECRSLRAGGDVPRQSNALVPGERLPPLPDLNGDNADGEKACQDYGSHRTGNTR